MGKKEAGSPKQKGDTAPGSPKKEEEAPKEKKEKAEKAPKEKKEKKAKEGGPNPGGGNKEPPAYLAHRAKLWDEFAARRAETAKKLNKDIKIKLPDGKVVPGKAGITTPSDIAKGISEALEQNCIVAKVNGEERDMFRPLTEDCELVFCKWDSPEGQHTFWHSSAHVLGQAIEAEFANAKLCIGPPVDDGGFYYDVALGDTKISQADYKVLQAHINKITKEKQTFHRLELKKEEALEMFADNKYKVEMISTKVPDGEFCTAYRNGNLIDLCRGPHIPHTGKIKAMTVTKNSSAYWLGKAENDSLQRVYGISFPDKKLLKEWEELMEEAEKRDHRRIGTDQKLFFFHDLSPGSCFFLPHGARVYNKLMDFIRGQYKVRGFTEVVTPNVYNVELWKTSGHWANYKENMFAFEAEKVLFGMKPMNCPGHCLMFGHTLRSYRELPMRLADFGVLHRNELSGALTGLTRVRRFQQDDAHIFCRFDQIKQEVLGSLDFLQYCYGIFGFSFELQLSTRPAKFMGELQLWDDAEKALAECLDEFGMQWTINEADGAFYGPKIDIKLTDALKRKHQCATIQLDFQLPIKFNLQYKNQDSGFSRPVIVHRAILGSVERMFAVLIEHTGGKWPFWLSPRQVCVIPVSNAFNEYGEEVTKLVHDAGYHVDFEDSNKQLPKKIREAQIMQYNYILIVGADEKDNRTVTIRNRDDPEHQHTLTLAQLLHLFKRLTETHS